jgi:hypothetical protein
MRKPAVFVLLAVLTLVLVVPAFGQTNTGKIFGHKVTIVTNAPNFQVFVDDRPFPGPVLNMADGRHRLRITAPGFLDWNGVVIVTADMTVNAPMRSAVPMFPLTVLPSVNGAAIFVDGVQAAQNTVPVPAGSHTVTVTAPGYLDFTATVNVASPLTVQAPLQVAFFPLTIQPSVPNAAIFVDGGQISGNVVNVAPGTHAIRVVAPGFQEFSTSVNVSGPLTVNAPLAGMGIAVTVQSNVQGPQVSIDGAPIAGNVAYVRPGRHTVHVTAPGYQDFTAVVNVVSPIVVNATLNPAGFLLTVMSNVQGAAVSVNSVARGATPYAEALPPGTYTVAVSAPGYAVFTTTVNLAQPVTVNAQLLPGMATLSFVIPPRYIDRDRGKDREGGQLKLSVDGKTVPFRRDAPTIQLPAGRHRIVMDVGALDVPLADFDFAPGMSYTVELFMELRARAGN